MNRVLTGSCLAPDALPSLPPKSVDAMIFDPQYDKRTHENQRRGCTGYVEPTRPGAVRAQFNRKRELGFAPMTAELMTGVAQQCARLARRWALSFCSLEMISSWRAAFEAAGLEYVRTCLWHKRGAAPQFTGDRPGQSAEAIVCAHARKPDGSNMKKRWNGRGAHGWYDFDFDPEDDAIPVIFDDPIVLNRGKDLERFHTTQKPLKLMQKLVALFSDPGELVCDPFAGSGTTGVACETLGRGFIGVELDSESADVANWRIAGARASGQRVRDLIVVDFEKDPEGPEPNVYVTSHEHGIDAVRLVAGDPGIPEGAGVIASAASAREALERP